MDFAATLEDILHRYRNTPGALLPVLHAVQRALGYVPPQAVPAIAQALALSRAEVHGVISYYHHFRQTPPPRHVLRLCRAEACQAVGSEALAEWLDARPPSPAVRVEPVYCLGLCACGPAAQVDADELHARLTEESLAALLDRLESAP